MTAAGLFYVTHTNGDLDVATGDTVTVVALLELGFRVMYEDFDPPAPGMLWAEVYGSRAFLEAREVPSQPLYVGTTVRCDACAALAGGQEFAESIVAYVDEAADFAETGELHHPNDAVPLEALTLTQVELDLFPEGLAGTVIGVKSEYYRKGRDDTRTRVLASLSSETLGIQLGGRRTGKSLAARIARAVAQACGVES